MAAWWTNMMGGLGSFLVNPAIFLAGAALISVPILIHLLNRRKFKIVDWAAMDFLLEADKKNRRRVRLENFLLLAMRCLAVFLLGLLLARPFDSSGLAARLFDAQEFERIIVVDDSLSMQSRIGNRTAMEISRDRLVDLVRSFTTEKENRLTVLLTSNPEQRKFNGVPIGAENVEEIAQELERIEASELPSRLENTLLELDTYLSSQPGNVNRVVYIVSDLRRRDWQPDAISAPAGEGAAGESPAAAETDEAGPAQPVELLRKIAKQAAACYVVDVGNSEDRNLVIREVVPEKTLVAGVESRFDVKVANTGSQEIRDVRVKFTAGESVPLTQTIESIAAGAEESLRFSFTFAREEDDLSDEDQIASRKVKIELLPERAGEDDRLAADSTYYFAARVVPGIPTLLVDGDPSASYGKAETFYLKRALSPPGRIISGVAPEVVTETELEGVELDNYQVIFLCNLYRLSDKSIDDLRAWVEKGGGLVILPGDQVDEAFFNKYFFGEGENEGKELSPLRLESLSGDETEKSWANFRIDDAQHPVLKDFAGTQNPILNRVQIYRWWKGSVKRGPGIPPADVLMRFSDAEDSIALVERAFGQGRVVVSTIPADADWTTWTSDPSYILIMQEMVRYLAKGDSREGALRVGEPLRHVIDLTKQEMDSELLMPGQKRVNLQANQLAGAQESRWLMEHKSVPRQGFYELALAVRGGEKQTVLFAGNVDPAEGDLRRANVDAMQRELQDANVQFLSGAGSTLGGIGAQMEMWKYILWILVGLLMGEQVLGWLFGRRR
jgi:hypothetical protein